MMRFTTVFFLAFTCLFPAIAFAQISPPDRKFLFPEDAKRPPVRPKKTKDFKAPSFRSPDDSDSPFDIDAPNVRYDSQANQVFADGGVTITRESGVFQAQRGVFNLDDNTARLEEDVFLSDRSTTISAESADVDIEEFTGQLNQCQIDFVDGSYILDAEVGEKLDQDSYKLTDASATTCKCPEGGRCVPWRLSADRVEVTKEGYGKVWDATLEIWDVPVFYLPYGIFPAKTERQTGLLPAQFGVGNQTGFELYLPFFWAIDESTDATITPLIETEVRYGSRIEFRKEFSRRARLRMGGTYLNESPRDGELLGTSIDGLDDPEIDENRVGAFLDYRYGSSIGDLPVQVILDGNYVSDDLFLREFPTPDIAPFNTRYVTSRAVLRTNFLDVYSADLRGEFSQAMVSDDDVVFQRLPQLNVNGIHRWKPFGNNPYGLKLVLANNLEAVRFSRSEGFDGWRLEAEETLRVPFFYRNFFRAEVGAGVRGSLYELDDRTVFNDDGTTEELEKSTDRLVPEFTGKVSTIVEKVFPVAEGGFLSSVAELGSLGKAKKLVRVKHTIEPQVRYRFVPFVDQRDNPQFDSDDRLVERNVVSYELVQRLWGRFDARDPNLFGIEEVTPEVDDLGVLLDTVPLDDTLGYNDFASTPADDVVVRRGEVRELLRLSLGQSFDILEDRKDNDPLRSGLADLEAELLLLPNQFVRFRGKTDFDVEETEFNSYSLEGQFRDDRGDELRTSFTFVRDRVRQLESSIHLRMTENAKIGYYTRYDDLDSDFIENKIGLRLTSACDCWIFDIEYAEESNPDHNRVGFVVTLVGLGEFGNRLFSSRS